MSVPTFYKQEAVTTSSATPLNCNEMGKNAKKEKVYGDANMIPLAAAAERATQRSGPQELTGKVTGLLGVLKARISYAQARRQRRGLGGGRKGKVNPPIQVDSPLEGQTKIPVKTINLPEPLSQGHNHKLQKGSKKQNTLSEQLNN